MPPTLDRLQTALALDPGLVANVSPAERAAGLAAASALNAQLLRIIAGLNLNADGIIRPEELLAITAAIQGNPAEYAEFLEQHGDDEGNVETAFHLLQNDGGTLMFRGRKFVDTVADAIYHYGFDIIDGRYVNEDGNANETTRDVAGWLNFFMNGVSTVFGTDAAETLHSGDYSSQLAAARNETFWAGGGDDSIWADIGHDRVWAGTGNDVSGGGDGNDTLMGETGDDTLWGETGNDSLDGGAGHDRLGGGDGNDNLTGGDGHDTLYGEAGNDSLRANAGNDVSGGGEGNDSLQGGLGNDTIYADEGNDRAFGEDGDDQLHGSDGTDYLIGGAGNDGLHGGDHRDTLSGGDGNDTIRGGEAGDVLLGGKGQDLFTLWESVEARDVLVFSEGDSGRTRATIDRVEGFQAGIDKINLRSFGSMTFEDIDFSGAGASAYYDGRYLRIDVNGDRAVDMMVEFAWVDALTATDFLLT